jgi:hypothetical protein
MTSIYYSMPAEVVNARPYGPVFVDPTVNFNSPAAGATTGSQPTITATITVGDVYKNQISLGALKATLDGKDVKGLTDFQVAFGDPQPDATFVTTQLSFTPAAPILNGRHRFVLEVPAEQYSGQGPGKTIATLEFTSTGGPSGPSTETRPATRDALVYERDPHFNEGANPRLTLEKITGKASRDLLGFDLSNVDTSSLTKATLVLTIDNSDLVTGWGNGGTVSLRPLTTGWQEGNGKRYALNSSEQTAGNGAGATWFSPVDSDISNGSSNGTPWSGGSAYLAAGSAPPLTVRNHQAGELRFDVTTDVRNGVINGWLLRKDAEDLGSKVSFYSREGGGSDLGPRLILQYGQSTAATATPLMQVYSNLGEVSSSPLVRSVVFPEALRLSPALGFVGSLSLCRPWLTQYATASIRRWLTVA